MSFKASVWAGRFAPDLAGLPAPQEPVGEAAVLAVLARFADRDGAGGLVPPRRAGWPADGRRRLLGYIAGEYVVYHRAGFAEAVFGGADPRVHGFLAACVRELGCGLLDANNWASVTDHYLGLADAAPDASRVGRPRG